VISHPGAGAVEESTQSNTFSGSMWQRADPANTLPEQSPMNAGYSDGHVESYLATDTHVFHSGANGNHLARHCIPEAF
jgi:hypothetical protein